MKLPLSKRFAASLVCGMLLGCGGGGGGGGGGITGGGTPTALFISPTSVTLGAVGSAKQMTTTYKDASNNVVNGTTVIFTLSGTGASATVSNSGLVTAVAPGQGVDTVVATGSGLTAKAPIFVTQVPASVTVTSTSVTPDTLFAASRQRQFSATVRDSNSHTIAVPGTITWSSNATGVASVAGATGLVTAVADGAASIQATIGGVNGSRSIIVRRLPFSHSLTPPTASITTNGGSAGPFAANVTDSASIAIPVTWVTRSPAVFSVSSSTGTSINVNAAGNGSAYLVTTIPAVPGGLDSSSITVSGQPVLPTTIAVSVGDDFFKSGRNGTCGGTGASTCTSGGANAVDTIAVGGTVTWTWVGVAAHSVQSTGSPSFVSSTTKASGTYALAFNTAGTYTYDCIVHGAAMTGIIVVK